MKRIKFFGIICGLMLTLTLTAFAASSIKIVINGKEAVSSVQPTMQNGSIMVPLRFVSEQLGMDVKWDGNSKTASINNKKSGVSGSITLVSNGIVEADDGNINLNGVNTKSWYTGDRAIPFYASFDNVSEGFHDYKISIKDTSGKEISSKVNSIDFSIEEYRIPFFCYYGELDVNFPIEGTYWLEVYLDDELLNRTAIYTVNQNKNNNI